MPGLVNGVYEFEPAITGTLNGQYIKVNDGTNTIGHYIVNGTPEGVIAADIGSQATDATNGDLYMKTTDTANTGWIQLSTSFNRLVPGVSNLGIVYDVGTGVFSVQGANAALSTSNPGYVTFQSKTTPGELVTIAVESNQSFIDDNGASEIIGNLFGHTTGRIVDQDIPFFIYAVPNDAETSIAFMICRVPYLTVSPAAANIGDPGDPVADLQNDFWSIDTVTEADYEDNPCIIVGCFRMRMSTSDDWTVQTLDDELDGIGKFFESHYFTQVKGHYSADAASYFVLGAATTVPDWTVEGLFYSIQKNGRCNWQVAFSGDPGTVQGNGAVAVQFASPFFGPNIDFAGSILSATVTVTSPCLFIHTSANRRLVQIRNAGTYTYNDFTVGNRALTISMDFRVLAS